MSIAFQRARKPEEIETRRRALLAAAAELFDAEGPLGAGLNAIAARAGFTKSNVYRYFESREQVLLALFLAEMDEMVPALCADLAAAPEDDVRLEPGQARFIALRVLTRDSAGRPLPHGVERLALIAAPARGSRLDLRGLAGPVVMRGSEAAPDVDRPGLAALVFPLRVQD